MLNNSKQPYGQQSSTKKLTSTYQDSSSNQNNGFVMTNSPGPSLKGKFHVLEDSVQQVSEELNAHRRDFEDMQSHSNKIQKTIVTKSTNVKENLKKEIEKCEDEMKRHFSHQKAENSRLQQQISQLKSEKQVVSSQMTALNRRIADIESQIGNDDYKIEK